jgi:hypothetical protein
MARRVIVFAVMGLLASSIIAMGPSQSERHCAVFLVPTVGTAGGSGAATEIDLGCYPTFAEAVEAGSAGRIDVSSDTTPAALAQESLDVASADAPTSVIIGTEYTDSAFSGSSKSYFAAETCSSTQTWDVSYVTDAWNDDFESGKGFGSCDHNRKFHDSNFGGTSIVCTPNCSDYGALDNEVSSLRWKL